MIRKRASVKNKSQAAMEFLMTYGWAILVILIAIVALSYFGVLSPDRFITSRCFLPPGISCVDFNMESSSVTAVLQNSLGGTVTINKIDILKQNSISCSNIESKELKDSSMATFTLLGCNNGDVGEKFDGEISITFTKKDGLTHTTKGRMVATITAGAGSGGNGGGGGNITCSSDSDCGTSGFVGDYYCENDYISQNQTDYTCLNPGTEGSSCIASNTSVQLTYCDPALNEVCEAGNATCGINETTPNIQIIQITTDPATQTVPVIYGNKIAWMDKRNGGWDIYMYDISTGQETRITTITSSVNWPAIYGDIIAWEDLRNGNWDIYMYDISTGQESLVSTGKFRPSIYGDKVAYRDSNNIFVYDLSTGLETQITTNGVNAYRTSIYGDKIVYENKRTGNWEIYIYDLSTGQETQIITEPGPQWEPDIYENKIVYTDARTGTGFNPFNNIFMYDLSAGQETQITIDPGNIADQNQPSVYGNIIVWEAWDNIPPWRVDIYMYDLSTGQETQVTTSQGNHEFADVYENKIVWVDNRNGNWDIYMAIIS